MRSTSRPRSSTPGQHEAGVERGEGGLEAGHAHRRLLERLLLLLARVRGVVGGDAVDRARAQRPRSAPGGRPRARSGGFILKLRVERPDRLVGQQQVVRRGLAGDLHARGLARARSPRPSRARTRAGRGCGRPRRRRARSRARPSCRLGDRRDAGQAEQRRDLALVHHAVARQRRVLLVQREHAARPAAGTGAPGASRRPTATGRPSSVKPAAPASRELGHLGQLLAPLPDGDRGQEAGRDARLGARRARAASAAPAPSPPPGSVLGMARIAQKPPAAAARVPESMSSSSSRPGVRRCTCGSTKAGKACRPSASTTSAPSRRLEPRSPISAITPSRTSRSRAPVEARRAGRAGARRGSARSPAGAGRRGRAGAGAHAGCGSVGSASAPRSPAGAPRPASSS